MLLAAIAVIPGLLLIKKVYDLDKIEKEPRGLLLSLVIWGAIICIPAVILEIAGEYIVLPFFEEGSISYAAAENFITVALVEEGLKYRVLKSKTWKNEEFNFRFDAIVYAVCVSMGFAILENIEYSLMDGIEVALLRAVTSIPGHCVFSIFMGNYYGEAKLCEGTGDKRGMKKMLKKALWMPVLIHGFYDFVLSVDGDFTFVIFIVFILYLYISTFRKLKTYASQDKPV